MEKGREKGREGKQSNGGMIGERCEKKGGRERKREIKICVFTQLKENVT